MSVIAVKFLVEVHAWNALEDEPVSESEVKSTELKVFACEVVRVPEVKDELVKVEPLELVMASVEPPMFVPLKTLHSVRENAPPPPLPCVARRH